MGDGLDHRRICYILLASCIYYMSGTHLVDFRILYDDLHAPVLVQLMLRFINFYLGVVNGKNPIASICLCSQLCSLYIAILRFAKNKQTL